MSDIQNFIKDIKLSICQEPLPNAYNMKIEINYGKINHVVDNNFLIISFDNNNEKFDKKYRDILNACVSVCFTNTTNSCFSPRFGIENVINVVGLIETSDAYFEYTYNNKNYCFVSIMQVQNMNSNTCILWNICTCEKYRNKGYFSKIFEYFISTKCINDKIYLYVKQEQNDVKKICSMYIHLGFKFTGWNKDNFLFEYIK